MLPVINIGPLALPAPELFLLLGFWLGLDLTEKQAAWFQVDAGKIYNLVLTGLLAGLVGARLVYAARSPAAFLASPLNLLALRPDMFDGTGGLLAALLAGLVYVRVKHLALWPSLDALVSLLAVLGVTIGLANLASGNAFGAPAQLPWSINLWGEARHPSQVYETLAALLIGVIVWPGGRIAQWSRQAGAEGLRLWGFLALSAGARIFLEAFRGDSVLLWDSLRVPQLISWLVLAASLWQTGRRLRGQRTDGAIEEALQHEPKR